MIKPIHLLVIICLIHNFVNAQITKKVYYNSEWIVVPDKKDALYYRVITKESQEDPGGKVKDYFITGELQGEGEGIRIDSIYDINSVWKGKLVGYYQSGKMRFENNYNQDGRAHGLHTDWYENGNKRIESHYDNGGFDGYSTSYFESGKEQTRILYSRGKVVNPWTTCDENGSCQKLSKDEFRGEEDSKGWNQSSNENDETEIFQYGGLRMRKKSLQSHVRAVSWDIDIKNDFNVEAGVKFSYGEKAIGFGIVFGYQDESNYQFFYINAEGNFKTGTIQNGKVNETKWEASETIYKDEIENMLLVSRHANVITFSINEVIIKTLDYKSSAGNLAGIGIDKGEGETQVYLTYMQVSVPVKK
jgi:antitoxin component YwqK of YwqJK toxin-antitoxin module